MTANFKEAGEAKENYDLRKIFDNTSVVDQRNRTNTDQADCYKGDPWTLCKCTSTVTARVKLILIALSSTTYVIWCKEKAVLTISTTLRSASRSSDGYHPASSPSPTP